MDVSRALISEFNHDKTPGLVYFSLSTNKTAWNDGIMPNVVFDGFTHNNGENTVKFEFDECVTGSVYPIGHNILSTHEDYVTVQP